MARSKAPAHIDIVLVAVEGDVDPGAEHLVTPDVPVPIGRSAKGITLLDPMVSIQHAVISFDLARDYVIQDLNSATGTWVDEECIKGESRPIGVGTMLRFGDSVFEVARPSRLLPWMRIVAAVAAGVVFVAAVLFIVPRGAPKQQELVFDQPVMAYDRTFATLQADPSYLRTRGLAMRDLAVRDVTDCDNNGISEVWLDRGDQGQVVITFRAGVRASNQWSVLGEFPSECVRRGCDNVGDGFPVLECDGTVWMMFEKGYELQDHEDSVVYYRPRDKGLFEDLLVGPEGRGKAKAKAKKGKSRPSDAPLELEELEGVKQVEIDSSNLEVARFAMKDKQRRHFASFLVEKRNILGPVHYIICEDAFEGLKAQAVTADGQVHEMSPGCLNDLRLEGRIDAEPVAVALSAIGHKALVDDVTTFYSGNPDGLWLTPKDRRMLSVLEDSPGPTRGGTTLVAYPKVPGPFDPKPDPYHDLKGTTRRLIHVDPRRVAAPLAETRTPINAGLQKIDPPGCPLLLVEVAEFENYGLGALFPGMFMTVTEAGCSSTPRRLMSLDYAIVGSGIREARVGDLAVRAVVETRAWGRGTQVLRARVTFRDESRDEFGDEFGEGPGNEAGRDRAGADL